MKRSRIILFVAACICETIAFSQTGNGSVTVTEEFPLYEGAVPGNENRHTDPEQTFFISDEHITVNVSTPTLTAYLPSKEKATGAAMVVCPGGGYFMLSIDVEGHNVARALAEKGIAAFVLKYRLAPVGETVPEIIGNVSKMLGVNPDNPSEKREQGGISQEQIEAMQKIMISDGPSITDLAGNDGRAAMSYVRHNASQYGIDPSRIGIIGFSAGSGVTLDVAFNHDQDSKPSIVVPVYGSRAAEVLPPDPVPMFFLSPQYDVFGEPTAYNLYKLYHQNGLPAELHYFTGTKHGFGYKADGEPVNVWVNLLYNFMIKVGFLPEGTSYSL